MRLLIVFLSVLFVFSNVLTPLNAQDNDLTNCPTDSLEPRMVAGLQGRVLPGDANRLREDPSTDAETLGFIPGEASFYVYAGPVCADDFVWWQVEYDGQIGWTVEGSDEYWIEPLTDTLNISLDDVCFDWTEGLREELTGEVMDASEFSRRDIEGDLPILSFMMADAEFRSSTVLTIYPAQQTPFWIGYETSDVSVLSEILETRPDDVPYPRPVDLFFMPTLMETRAEYLNFENGSGIRYFVHTGQDSTFVNPIYTFMGLTEDNLYLVQFRMFIRSIDLNTSPEIMEIGDIRPNYNEFIALASEILTEAEPDTFVPDLNELDSFINSIRVGVGACAEEDETQEET